MLVKIAPCTMIEAFPPIKLLERLSMAIACDTAAELGSNPVCKHQIQPEFGDEQTDAGRYCRTHLARPNSLARTRTGSLFIFPVQLTTFRIDNLTRLIHTLAICMTIYTHTTRISLHVVNVLFRLVLSCLVLSCLVLAYTIFRHK